MCGRSSLTKTEKEIEQRFKATFYSEELARYNPLPNFNVAPTHMMPVILSQTPDKINIFRWGLIPRWAKEKSIGAKMINAKSETLLEKPAFKSLVQSQRCLVPMDGFYEWRKEGKLKIPYRIVSQFDEIYSVCGLWDKWMDAETKEFIHSFTIITVPANNKMNFLHERMPVILTKESEKLWLDEDIPLKESLTILKTCPDEAIDYYRVSERVNSVKVNDAALIDRIPEITIGVQTTLF